MPQLVLQPKMRDMTRAEYEAWLEGIRSRRLVAAVEYAQAQKLKLDHESDVLQHKLAREIELFGANIERMEKLDEKIQDQMTKIETYRQELGFIEEIKTKGLDKDEEE